MISGPSAENMVSIEEIYNIVKRFVLNKEIDNSHQWLNTAPLMLASATASFATNFNDTVSLGIKIYKDEGDYFGWIYLD